MAQLDFFSYSDQYLLVATTFWVFYVNSIFLFILPFTGVMKMRHFIAKDVCHDEILIEDFLLSTKSSTNKIVFNTEDPRLFV